MKGHIRKRGERSWAIVVDIGRDPSTGKRKQKWITVKGTKRQAEQEMARILNELNTGQYVEPAKLTVAEYMRKWLEDYARLNVRPTTFDSYEDVVIHHIIPGIGGIRLDKLTPLQIQRFYADQLANGRADGKPGGLSSRAVSYIHARLRQALGHAVRLGLLARNPALVVPAPKEEQSELQVWTASEAKAFLKAAKNSRYYPIYLMALHTGLRCGEMLGLRWSDVDLDRGFVSIQQTLTRCSRGVIVQPPKTRRSRRTVVLTRTCVTVLRGLATLQEKEAAGKTDFNSANYVFTSRTGRHVGPRNLTRQYESIVRRIDLPYIPFHGLRHVHATLMAEAGINPKAAADRLGHCRVSMTLDRYTHASISMQRQAALAVEKALEDD